MSSSNRPRSPSDGGDTPEPLPRLQSSPDLDGGTSTFLSDVVAELARLDDRASVPQLTRLVAADVPMTPEESFILSLVGTSITIDDIIRRSPISEDETLHFVARMITTGLITIPAK